MMPTYSFNHVDDTYIHDLADVDFNIPAIIYPVHGEVGAVTAIPEASQVIAPTAPGEFEITTVLAASYFIFYFADTGDYSLLPAPVAT